MTVCLLEAVYWRVDVQPRTWIRERMETRGEKKKREETSRGGRKGIFESRDILRKWQRDAIVGHNLLPRVSGLAQCVQPAASSEERLGQNQHQGRRPDGTSTHTLEHYEYGAQHDPLV